jgi:hypothetical protein
MSQADVPLPVDQIQTQILINQQAVVDLFVARFVPSHFSSYLRSLSRNLAIMLESNHSAFLMKFYNLKDHVIMRWNIFSPRTNLSMEPEAVPDAIFIRSES